MAVINQYSTIASIRTTRLRASVSVVAPKASAVLQPPLKIPVAAVEYILLTVESELDPLNRNPYLANTLVILDTKVVAFAKAAIDSLSMSDNVSLNVLNAFDESPTVTDQALVAMLFLRNFADSLGVSESSVIEFGKNLTEAALLQDQILSQEFDKALTDGVAMNDMADVGDGFEFQFEASFSNVAFVNEDLVRALAKAISDQANIVEQASIAFDQDTRQDSFSASDNSDFDFGKNPDDTAATSDQLNAIDTGKGLTDTPTVTEDLEKDFSTDRAEAISLADSAYKDTAKALSDSGSVADASSIDFSQQSDDSVSMADFALVEALFARSFSDTATVSESLAYSLAMAFADSASAGEQHEFLFEASKSESVSLSDTALLEAIKSFSDSISLSDASVLDVEKGLSDSPSVTDALDVDGSYALTDGVGMNDALGFGFTYVTSFSNVAFVGDASAIEPGKGLSDSATPDDSGSLISQGYCDITYFAEDYVGDSRTFT